MALHRFPLQASFLVMLALLGAGCATQPGQVTPAVAFDPAEVAWAAARGRNAVRGSAVMRPPGAEARTCAGATVALLPDSRHTRDRLQRLYGALDRGSNDLAAGKVRQIEAADPGLARVVRTTTCDIHGRFGFSALPDGIWYVTTAVAWRTRGNDPSSQAGAALMQRLVLGQGVAVQVQLGDGPAP
jgi:hypothetical protein